MKIFAALLALAPIGPALADTAPLHGAPDTVFTVTGGPAVAPQTGWYWNAAEPGRGFFVERNAAGRAFVATFHYLADGSATWFAGQGPMTDGVFGSPIATFSGGQTLAGPARAPTAQPPFGAFVMQFATDTQAALYWPAQTVPLTRFPFRPSGNIVAPPPGSPENGWWWNPAEPGRGFALEIQGDWLFGAGFMYADDGRPTWYQISGPMGSPTRFAGSVLAFRDGQALGAPHRAPTQQPTIGGITIDFVDSRNAIMWLPDLRVIPLTRFQF